MFERENGELNILIDYIKKQTKISRENVEELFDCSKTTALRILNKYVEKEIIKQVRIGNKTYYELA